MEDSQGRVKSYVRLLYSMEVFSQMSGIFGIINFDNSQVAEESVRAMSSAMSEWGPDGQYIWAQGEAALGCMVLHSTPQALQETGPLVSNQGFVLAVEARIDNRPELYPMFGLNFSDGEKLSDSKIVLLAYEKWGTDTPKHLIGDWSFAAWHPAEKKVFLARDHSGNTSLYYYWDKKHFAFASSRKALQSLGNSPRLNEIYLAGILVGWHGYEGPETIELDIHRLPPAHRLFLSNGILKTDIYWRWEDTPEIKFKSSQDYADGLLEIFDRAIRDRLRSCRTVGSTLSGGLDSSSVTVLASRALSAEQKRISAYAYYSDIDTRNSLPWYRVGNEFPLAQSTAEFDGNIDLNKIMADGLSPISAMRRSLEIHGEPPHAAGYLYWIFNMLSKVKEDGHGVLLTGQGGNATLSWEGKDTSGMFRHYRRSGEWRKILYTIVSPLIPLSIHRNYRKLRKKELDWSVWSINAQFARDINFMDIHRQGMGTPNNPEAWYSPRLLRFYPFTPGASIVGAIWAENAAAYSLEIRDPTLDPRVMEFALSIPEKEFMNDRGMNRLPMRKAMKGLLPDNVRLLKKRGAHSGDIVQRYLDSAGDVETALNAITASDAASYYLSVNNLRKAWNDMQKGPSPENTRNAIAILSRGIMAGMYILSLDQ